MGVVYELETIEVKLRVEIILDYTKMIFSIKVNRKNGVIRHLKTSFFFDTK